MGTSHIQSLTGEEAATTVLEEAATTVLEEAATTVLEKP